MKKFLPIDTVTARRVIHLKKVAPVIEGVSPAKRITSESVIDGRLLKFSIIRRIVIQGAFVYDDDLYIFRHPVHDGSFAYTTVDASKTLYIAD